MYALGECIKRNFKVIRDNPEVIPPMVLVPNTKECCFSLPALAEVTFTNELFNDKHSPLFFFNNGFSSALLYLEKYINGVWTVVKNLTDNTYGIFYDYGFFENIYKEKPIGIELNWASVLNDVDLGEGRYRVKATGTTLMSTTVDRYSFDFCLKEYNQNRADETVRISWWMNGSSGDPEDDKKRKDFGTLDWFNQLRLPLSKFGWDETETERNYVKYETGKKVWLKDSDVESYLLKVGQQPNELRRFIKFDLMKASDISITDYNIVNATRHENRFVIPASGHKPNYYDNSIMASVELKFEQQYQNHTHKRC